MNIEIAQRRGSDLGNRNFHVCRVVSTATALTFFATLIVFFLVITPTFSSPTGVAKANLTVARRDTDSRPLMAGLENPIAVQVDGTDGVGAEQRFPVPDSTHCPFPVLASGC